MVRILLKVLKTANIEFIAVILIGILNLKEREIIWRWEYLNKPWRCSDE